MTEDLQLAIGFASFLCFPVRRSKGDVTRLGVRRAGDCGACEAPVAHLSRKSLGVNSPLHKTTHSVIVLTGQYARCADAGGSRKVDSRALGN